MRGCLFFLFALLVLSAGCGTMAPRESLPAWEQLHMAAGAGNLVGAMQVAQRGVDVNVRDPQGCTALMAAAIQGEAHVAYVVDDIEKALQGKNVLWPITTFPTMKIAFVYDGDVAAEYIQLV